MSYKFLLDLALILLSTKILGLVTRKIHMPQVVGALLAGLILGPAMFNVLQEGEFITQLSEIGVIVLMFTAGMETNIKELKNCGKASAIIALLGVVVPLVSGTLLGVFCAPDDSGSILEYIFIGVVLTATSVSITVETLKEMGKLNTKVSNTILGAAIIDDILGIIILTVISSFADKSVNIGIVLLKIVLFFVFAAVVGVIVFKLYNFWCQQAQKDLRRYVIMALVFCLFLSYTAEQFFGVADITGAFIAGLVLSGTKRSHYICARFETLSYLFLSPIFFASVGINVKLPGMSGSIILFTVLLVIVAVLSKMVACYLGARFSKFNHREGVQIGAGMVSRGEVALIVATKGKMLGLLNDVYLGPIILMIVITTIIAPMLLKFAFRHKKSDSPEPPKEIDPYEGKMIDSYDGSLIE